MYTNVATKRHAQGTRSVRDGGSIHVYSDGFTASGNEHMSSGGWVIYPPYGADYYVGQHYYGDMGLVSTLVEYRAACDALLHAHQLEYSGSLVLHIDCQVIVRQYEGSSQTLRTSTARALTALSSCASLFRAFRIEWITRDINQVADDLAYDAYTKRRSTAGLLLTDWSSYGIVLPTLCSTEDIVEKTG